MKPEYANTFGLRKVADPQGQIPQGRHAKSRQSLLPMRITWPPSL